MDINNLLALDSNKQNYPNLNLPSDAKYYVSAEEYNTLIKALQSWITDYNAKVQALEDSVYRLPIVTVDSVAPLSDENILSSARTLLEIIKELAKLDDKFLSSLTPDTAEGKITFKDGLDIGSDQKGAIDSYGNAELNSLKLRQWLEVPELRFNRVEVQMGDKWRSPGGGIVESVDTANNIITLKLTDGEVGAVAKGDLCVGIFHSMINENNATADVDDSKNNRSIKGFATCYFEVIEIIETAKKSKFKYVLREESGNYPKQISPEAFMNFAVFGNRSNTGRRSSVFESRTYQRFLINVNDWEINKYNVAAQFGDLSNLANLGISGMSGYSAYLSNVYFSGTIFQVKPPIMKDGTWWEWDENLQTYVDTGVKVSHTGQSGFHHTLLNQSLSILRESSYFSHTWAELHVYEGSKELTYVTTTPTLPATYTVTLEASGVSPGDLYIENGTGADAIPFAKTTPIEAMDNDTGTIKFIISGIGSDSKEFLFTVNQTFVKVSSGMAPYIGSNGNWFTWDTARNEYVDSGIKAEGIDGAGSIVADLDNENQSISVDTDGTYMFGLPISAKFSIYSGATSVELDSLTVQSISGVTATAVKETGIVTVTEVDKTMPDKIDLEITGKATVNSIQYTREAYLTINKIRRGEKGDSPALYELRPSVTQIKKLTNGTFIPSTISCGLIVTSASGSNLTTTLPLHLLVQHSLDNGASWASYSLGTPINTASINTSVQFSLYQQTAPSTMLDIETIMIVEDGNSPYIGPNGNWLVWDSDLKKYVDSGDTAHGDNGRSPEIRDDYWWAWDGEKWYNTGIKAKGEDGHSPYIGPTGNWFVWDGTEYVDSGDKATGDNGKSPYIGENDNWWAWDGTKWYDTGIKAKGKDGKDGKDIEYVFTRTRTSMPPDIPQTTDAFPSGWTDNPVGVDDEWEYEWYIKRVRIDGVWSRWYNLQEWRHHVADGHDGKDGADREYIYIVNNDPNFNVEANRPINSPSNDDDDKDDYIPLNWSDNPMNPGPDNQYEWYCYRDKTGGTGNGVTPGTWGPWQGPYLWSRYGKDGKKGDPGIDGSSAPLLYLSASSQIMTCSTSNVPHPNQRIELEAKTQNIVIADLDFEATAFWTDPQSGSRSEIISLVQPGTDNRQRILTSEQWKPEYEKVKISAYLGYLNDDVTIHRLADPVEGSSAVVGFLTNGNITFAGFDDGEIIDRGTDSGGQYENGHGEFWVYEGLQRQTTGVEFSVVEQIRCSVIFLPNKVGVYQITGYTVNDSDSASAVLQAEYHGVTIKQVLTISVSRRGKVGKEGTNVPIVYRGVYSDDATYYGTPTRVDIVKIESNPVAYYRTLSNTGTIIGISPTNSSNYWVEFGANFESVATDLLLAERANIGGFVFYKDQIISQYGKYITSGNTANFSTVSEANISNWYPNIVLDGLGGEIVINSATVRGSIEAEKGKIGGWLIGANTFTSQLASYKDGPATPIDNGNLSYVQVTFWNSSELAWLNTYTQAPNNKYMRIRYGDQAWPELNINFVETGPYKITNMYEKHLQYEFGKSSSLTGFPDTWNRYPPTLESNQYLWIRQRSYQNILGKPTVIGLWSKPFRVSPVIMANTISPNISLNGNTGEAIFSGGKVKFNSDGSGHVANENIKWNATGDVTTKGIYKSNNEEILLKPDGSGHIANGNISWNTAGDVTTKGIYKSNNEEILLRPDGSGKLASGNISWDALGNTEYKGNLKGVTGSFRNLQAADSNGVIDPNVAITLATNPGRLWFKGDLQHQGYDSANSRGFRFLTADVWCRGTFGASQRNTAIVSGNRISYYTKGLSVESPYTVDLTSSTTGSDVYFTVPIYGGDGDASGFPVDILLFTSILTDNLFTLYGVKGGIVKVINLSTTTTLFIMANGVRVNIPAKSYAEFLNIGYHLLGYDSSYVGAGWMKIG